MQQLLKLALKAAVSAGDFLSSEASKDVLSLEGKDIKAKADIEAEKKIIEILSPSGIPILAEESCQEFKHNAYADQVWIVDPLDGTYNFIHNNPLCCVSIALFNQGKPVFGIINHFAQKEVYKGISGQGVSINDQQIKISLQKSLNQSCLATGFPVRFDFDSSQNFIQTISQFKKIRMLGSATLSLAYSSVGKTDCYFEEGICLWDVAAGLALIEAQGGAYVTKPLDEKSHSLKVLASHQPTLFEQAYPLFF